MPQLHSCHIYRGWGGSHLINGEYALYGIVVYNEKALLVQEQYWETESERDFQKNHPLSERFFKIDPLFIKMGLPASRFVHS